MIQGHLLQTIIYFLEREILAQGDKIDFSQVKKDLVERIKLCVPPQAFDSVGAFLVEFQIDLIAEAFKAKGKIDLQELGKVVDSANKVMGYALAKKYIDLLASEPAKPSLIAVP